MEGRKLRLERLMLMLWCEQATWVPIIYLFFPESKGRELEDFDRLFAGEGDVAIAERMAGNAALEQLGKEDSVAVKGGVVHEEKRFEGLV